MRRVAPVLGVALLVCAPCRSDAQTLRGLLLEEATELPIELGRLVLVTVEGDSVGATLTDEQGFFSVDAEDGGRFILVASALGYRSARSERMDLEDGEVKVTQMHLALRPIPVEGVDVTAPVPGMEGVLIPELVERGFYERLERGWGEFLTLSQIRAHQGTYTPQLFREMLSVTLVPDRSSGGAPWNDRVIFKRDAGSRRVSTTGQLGTGLCEPKIWVDNVLSPLMPGESLDDLAPKEIIEGIEVHRAGMGAPLRYFQDNSQNACGAILIWTNRR